MNSGDSSPRPRQQEASRPDEALEEIAALRSAIIDVWRERTVTHTRAEQFRLKQEVKETVELLQDLMLNT